MKNDFSKSVNALLSLVETVNKFEGFKIRFDIQEKIDTVNSEGDVVLAQLAYSDLMATVAGFIKNSPIFFRFAIERMSPKLDADIVVELGKALAMYKAKIESKPTLDKALDEYVRLNGYITKMYQFQKKRIVRAESNRLASIRKSAENRAKMFEFIQKGDFVREVSSTY